MKVTICKTALTTLTLLTTSIYATPPIDHLSEIYNYLVSEQTNGGALYAGTAGALDGYHLPLSYYDTPSY